METRFLGVVFGVLLIVLMVCGTGAAQSYCRCPDGTTVSVSGEKADCGGVCGGYTDCSGDCETCCSGFCSSFTDPSKERCMNSCTGKCALNGVIGMVLNVAGVVAAMILVICGYMLMTSANPEDRENAKKGIMYVILALVVVAIAEPLSDLLFEGWDTEVMKEEGMYIMHTKINDGKVVGLIGYYFTSLEFELLNRYGVDKAVNVDVSVRDGSCAASHTSSYTVAAMSSVTYSHKFGDRGDSCYHSRKFQVDVSGDVSKTFCLSCSSAVCMVDEGACP